MILVDPRVGSSDLAPIVRRLGVSCELAQLPFGDACMEGNGPKGSINVGIERKTIHDMIHCIDDARYSAHQKPGMSQMYDKCFLMVEGLWRPHDPEGWLMEFFPSSQKWGFCKPGGRQILYSKLRRYLFSVSLSGVVVLFTRDLFHTAFDVCEIYHYFQKKWSAHTSLLEKQTFNIPSLNRKASLVYRWAAELEDIGVKHGMEAERLFASGRQMAESQELDWLAIPGVGVKTAQKVVREINGWR